jgi:MFS family permease
MSQLPQTPIAPSPPTRSNIRISRTPSLSTNSTASDLQTRSVHLRIITGTVIAGFCCFLQLYAPQPLMVLFKRDFTASEARVSLVISAATFAVALASPFVGLLADAVGRKRVILPCLFALAVTTLGRALAPSLDLMHRY